MRAGMTSSPRSFHTRTRSPSWISRSAASMGLMKTRCGKASFSRSLLAWVECTRARVWWPMAWRGIHVIASEPSWRAWQSPRAVDSIPFNGRLLRAVALAMTWKRALPFLNIFRDSGNLFRIIQIIIVALEKISILPLGVLSGYFSGSRRKSSKAMAGLVAGKV